MNYSRVSIAALTIPLLLITACGGQAKTAAGEGSGRVIDVTMTDNSFAPGQIQVVKGETVTLRFHNNGAAVHEAVIGDDALQAQHHQQMMSGTGDGMNHGSLPTRASTTVTGGMDHGNMNSGGTADDDATTVQPGQTREMKHTFTDAGTTLIECHQPGHWEAGMKATLNVQ